MTGKEWLAQFAMAVGVPAPTDEEVENLLALAGEAAHQSERIAAPVSCWLAARAGIDAERALALARGIEPGE